MAKNLLKKRGVEDLDAQDLQTQEKINHKTEVNEWDDGMISHDFQKQQPRNGHREHKADGLDFHIGMFHKGQ